MNTLYNYLLHSPQFLVSWATFFAAGAIGFLYHIYVNKSQFSLKEMLKHCVPFDILRSKSFHMDLKMQFIHWLTDFIFIAPGVVLTAVVSNYISQILQGQMPSYTAAYPGYISASICIIVILLAVEFSAYIVHYAEHKIPILWELHKIHHSADFMNPCTAIRGHSIPLFYTGIVAGLIVGLCAGILVFLFKISFIEILALRAFSNRMGNIWTLSPLKHSHIPVSLGWFDRIFISPHMHQVHHSKAKEHIDKNFGVNLSIFDWLFKTGYRPARGEKIVLGLAGYSDAALQQFNTLRGAFIDPLLAIKKRISKRLGYDNGATNGSLQNTESLASPKINRYH